MTTFAVTDPAHTIAALNYALSNLNTGNTTGNTSIPGNVLVANSTTNAISTYSGVTPIAYVNQYLNVRYANSATGVSGFSINQANANYYGVFNTVTTSNPGANNAANYQWFQVTGGFGTTKTLYYLCNGGRQVQLAAANSAPSSGYLATVNGTPINLDIVTTANGTPGARGAIAMAYVLTPSDPNTAGNTALSAWFSASRNNTTPPLGTGLTPVSGDTADFLWPTTNASGVYTFDGSGWTSVVGQVVAGNTIVNGTITGNTIANSTITGNNIIVGTVSGDVIIANTLAGNTVIANTLYGNAIIANTLYGNAIIANTISGNSIIANTISGNSIIANSFSANSINGSAIQAGSIAANTINGNSIVSGSITTNQLAANVLTANTVVSTGATIGNFASPGFWLEGSSGNARFGNTVNIGSQLTVGTNANIGANATIGGNLIVGANANIGGNLFVSGLITSGSLNSNTVQTTTMIPASVSNFASTSRSATTIYSYTGFTPPVSNLLNIVLTTVLGTTVYVQGGIQQFTVNATPSGGGNTWIVSSVNFILYRNGVALLTNSVPVQGALGQYWFNLQGYADIPPAGVNQYTLGVQPVLSGGGTTPTTTVYSNYSVLLGQALKR